MPAPALSLDKSAAYTDADGSGTATAGDTITFSFTVTNTGNVPLTGLVIDDPVAGVVTCVDSDLAVGASTTCTAADHIVTLDDMDVGSVDNTATASASDPDGAPVVSPEDSTSTALEQQAGLGLVKQASLQDEDGDGRADAGEVIEYSFTVTNTGNVRVNDIVVDDSLLAAAGDPVTCPATTLDPGQEMVCTAEHTVTRSEADQDDIVNRASVQGASASAVVVSDVSEASVPGSPKIVLAYTGGFAGAALWAGAGLTGLGLLLLLLVRRRRDETGGGGR